MAGHHRAIVRPSTPHECAACIHLDVRGSIVGRGVASRRRLALYRYDTSHPGDARRTGRQRPRCRSRCARQQIRRDIPCGIRPTARRRHHDHQIYVSTARQHRPGPTRRQRAANSSSGQYRSTRFPAFPDGIEQQRRSLAVLSTVPEGASFASVLKTTVFLKTWTTSPSCGIAEFFSDHARALEVAGCQRTSWLKSKRSRCVRKDNP